MVRRHMDYHSVRVLDSWQKTYRECLCLRISALKSFEDPFVHVSSFALFVNTKDQNVLSWEKQLSELNALSFPDHPRVYTTGNQ